MEREQFIQPEQQREEKPAAAVQLDPQRQQQAREYARIRRRLWLVGLAIAAVGLVALFLFRLDLWLRDLLQPLAWQPLAGWYPLQVAGYFLILLLLYELISAPLTVYRGYILPRRYGLSVQTLGAWLGDLLKGLLLSIVLELAALELIYLLLATQPLAWWLWVALVMLLFSVVLANLAPVLVLPLFYRFTPLPDGELKARLLALAERAHTRVRGVFTMHMSSKTTAANAALMGLGNTRRIVIGDTLLDQYTPDEIEVVLAHELGHHVHGDIWKLIASQSLLTLVALYLINVTLHWLATPQLGYHGLADPATLPLIALVSAAVGLIFMPLGNAISRYLEYQADEYALLTTGKSEAFQSMMTRLANQNLAEAEPAPLVEILFHDHPSIKRRLEHAEAFARRQSRDNLSLARR
ncbi:MAG: M48 family metallopeptidase [Thermogemmatispora sp.]|uniref:M48 family metallopeptidase n=1 Tax=Thermogemmatispora sp. TaxID=1968838 RepID=UPI002631621B|nr:M48 family metallopeptidase [Thermogemmatispora sp.]MBX5456193.1 M48 family metallopeptidase [Thermogemmatispora sp.]